MTVRVRVVQAVACLTIAACAAASPLGDLAAEFRVLRAQRGHFSGGEWNDAVDRWDGRKHQVMRQLADALGDGTHSRADIIAMIGEPDDVLRAGARGFADAYGGGDDRVRQLLVYEWRGRHDFLFFTSDGTRVFAADWWFALE
jgi:hypothetical protein